tara:strand:+ start:150 stop:341 length:192 start_codon:yes stop_codon:yes gene_type:complete
METRVMIFDDDSEMENIAQWFTKFQNSLDHAGDIHSSAETTDELRSSPSSATWNTASPESSNT